MNFAWGVLAGLVAFAIAETIVWYRHTIAWLFREKPPKPKTMQAAEAIMQRHRPYILSALDYADGSYTYEDVVACVGAGKMQFWPGANSAVVTEIVQHPQFTALHIFLAGGKMEEIAAMTPHILAWGGDRGCEVCYFTGRKGWSRSYLQDWGFQDSGMVLLAKRLNGAASN